MLSVRGAQALPEMARAGLVLRPQQVLWARFVPPDVTLPESIQNVRCHIH